MYNINMNKFVLILMLSVGALVLTPLGWGSLAAFGILKGKKLLLVASIYSIFYFIILVGDIIKKIKYEYRLKN